jgi:hypothetical protein
MDIAFEAQVMAPAVHFCTAVCCTEHVRTRDKVCRKMKGIVQKQRTNQYLLYVSVEKHTIFC